MQLGAVAHAYNPSYLGGRNQKDHSSRPIQRGDKFARFQFNKWLDAVLDANHPSYARKHKQEDSGPNQIKHKAKTLSQKQPT
jgi:hypothetical protein